MQPQTIFFVSFYGLYVFSECQRRGRDLRKKYLTRGRGIKKSNFAGDAHLVKKSLIALFS